MKSGRDEGDQRHVDGVSRVAGNADQRADPTALLAPRDGAATLCRGCYTRRLPPCRRGRRRSFEGERLSGIVVSGNDWQNVRRDNCTKLDVRLLLKTTDDALIVMTSQCLRAGTSSVMEQLDRGQAVDPASYYFRFAALFKTGDTTDYYYRRR
jgi:Protein of unknown function (DUF3237)